MADDELMVSWSTTVRGALEVHLAAFSPDGQRRIRTSLLTALDGQASSFASIATDRDRLALSFDDYARGAGLWFSLFDRRALRGGQDPASPHPETPISTALVERRLSEGASIAFDPRREEWVVLSNDGTRVRPATLTRFARDGAQRGAPRTLPGASFRSAPLRTIGDAVACVVGEGRVVRILQFAGEQSATVSELSFAREPIEVALAFAGGRYALACSTRDGVFVTVQRDPHTWSPPVSLSQGRPWAGSPTLAFDGQAFRAFWTENPGSTVIRTARVDREGRVFARELFVSVAGEHAAWTSLTGGDAAPLVVTWQVGQSEVWFDVMPRPEST